MRLAADKGGGSIHLKPRECYIGAPPSARLHAEMFAFVDFGLTANRFLAACWSKQEPSVEDIALRLLSDPWKFYNSPDDRERLAYSLVETDLSHEVFFSFLDELRNIAHNIRSISRKTIEKMRQTPFLLSSRRQSWTAVDKEASQSFMDDTNKFECVQDDLRRPNQILIADDSNLYQLFGDSIFIAPQESKLEGQLVSINRVNSVLCRLFRLLHEVGFTPIKHCRPKRMCTIQRNRIISSRVRYTFPDIRALASVSA